LLAPFFPKSTKKIGIVHDILGIMAIVSDSPFKKKMIQIIRLLEKKSYNVCDKLIFVSTSMARTAIKHYKLNQENISVVYPFVTLSKNEITDEIGSMFLSGYKHIVYSGAIGEKQNPYELLKLFMAIVKKRNDVCCHFFSRGPLFSELKESISSRFDRIFFHDLVSEENVYELYLRSDVQIIPQKEGTSNGAIPSKLPNIINAGVPIFAIGEPGSELLELVRESMIGYCADSWNIDELIVELSKFIEQSSLKTHEERQHVVKYFVDKKFLIDGLMREIIA
jgi:glycosyltransferase involved in cell wall biosynthesis